MFPEKEDGFGVFFEALSGGDTDQEIRNQEKRGQDKLIESEVLPRKFNSGNKRQLEDMGVVFGENADDLFVYVTLPGGWRKESTDHSMWSKLVDEQGRERATIFYKAAFYDRDAFINISRRFSYVVRPVAGWGSKDSEWACFITDCEQEVWRSETLRSEPPYNSSRDGDDKRKVWLEWIEEKKNLSELGENWLKENYPDWKNPLLYW